MNACPEIDPAQPLLFLINGAAGSQDAQARRHANEAALQAGGRTVLSAIGKQEFKVVHPAARRLCSGNTRARDKYLSYLEQQMATHRMTECLQECERKVNSYPVTDTIRERMQ